MLRRAKKNNPDAYLAMCGCMAKNSPAPEGVDFVFDARKPDDFFSKINELSPGENFFVNNERISRTRAFIKIQDGCDRFCSYCIVPHVRGGLKSRDESEIICAAEKIISLGTLEIVLTGIQVAAYGKDIIGTSLAALIKKIAALNGLARLRLSSIDPWAVDENFLHAVEVSPVLCSHFHLSLQSGCDEILEKMNRRYTTKNYADAAHALKKIRPDAALTTDIIVGFPGESDAHFEKSMAFVREMEFAKIHVFEFSPREGTPAAEFLGQTPHKIKSERGKKMRALADELRQNFLQKQIGKTQNVLIEKKKENFFAGNSENYCAVKIKSETNITNQIIPVKISACEGEMLHGNPKNRSVSTSRARPSSC
jgi:threonylcarbamoyladenosine tRNA methylthiotransferase MtaB